MVSVQSQPQQHMEEQTILDPTLEKQLEEWGDTHEAAKKNRQAKAAIKALMKDRPPGLYRIGAFQIEIAIQTGGGFMLEKWSGPVTRIKAMD